MIKVKTIEELEAAKKEGGFFVLAVCCKCGESFSSIHANAEKVVTEGCVLCADWEPQVGVKIGGKVVPVNRNRKKG